MIRLGRKRGRALAAGAAVIAGLAGAYAAGLRVNATPSMPLGLWWVTPDQAPLRRGDIVVVCLPDTALVQVGTERGYILPGTCPGGSEPLVKPVAATGGDVVAVSATGVAVNGQALHGTAPLSQDSAGRPLRPVATGLYRVATGELWLLSAHDPRSFDSRYFGPLPTANVQGIARPLWVLQ